MMPLSLLFLYSTKSSNSSRSIPSGWRLHTSRTAFKPAAMTSAPTPG